MVKHDRRSHLSSILGDHYPAIHWEACGPVSRLSRQAGAQGDLFFSSSAFSQSPVETSESGYVIICGETNVHEVSRIFSVFIPEGQWILAGGETTGNGDDGKPRPASALDRSLGPSPFQGWKRRKHPGGFSTD
jgi:hypothetical protein